MTWIWLKFSLFGLVVSILLILLIKEILGIDLVSGEAIVFGVMSGFIYQSAEAGRRLR